MSDPSHLTGCITIPALANSDHLGLSFSISAGSPGSTLKSKCRKVWRYYHANFDHARELLDSTDWDSVFDSGDVNTCWAAWHSTFMDIMGKCIPQVVLHSRRNLPWLTKSVIQAIRKRNSLFRAAKRSKSLASYQRYRAARNHVVALLRLNKSKYFKKLQSKDSKAFWKAIRLLNKKESLIPTLVSNGYRVESSKEKATVLNHFFHDCFNKTLPPLTPQPSLLCPVDCPADLLCSEEEVFDLISSLDTSKSTGPDGISARMLKSVATSITPSITRLFNLSLSTGILPDPWKSARIVPILKSTQNQSSPTNYRPISILPLVSKLLEKHVHQLLFCHLQENYPISSRQWGFLPERSAQSALLSVTHNWVQQLVMKFAVFCSILLTVFSTLSCFISSQKLRLTHTSSSGFVITSPADLSLW